MPLSTIVAFVDPKHAMSTLETASFASKTLEASVDVVVVKRDPLDALPSFGESITGDLAESIIQAAEAAENAMAAETRSLFAAGPLAGRATFVEATGRDDVFIAENGRLYGLVVLPAPDLNDWEAGRIASALFETGRPTLIAPPQKPTSVGERIAIFWKSSPQAAKAVWSAMPFLRAAKTVTAFGLGSEAVATLEALSKALGRAGVTIETAPLQASSGDAGDTLLVAAAEMDADLIVMGAYSHHRLKELILGGVTQHILESVGRPVFLAH